MTRRWYVWLAAILLAGLLLLIFWVPLFGPDTIEPGNDTNCNELLNEC